MYALDSRIVCDVAREFTVSFFMLILGVRNFFAPALAELKYLSPNLFTFICNFSNCKPVTASLPFRANKPFNPLVASSLKPAYKSTASALSNSACILICNALFLA